MDRPSHECPKHVCGHERTTWGLEIHGVNSRIQSHVVRPGSKCFLLLSHLSGPRGLKFYCQGIIGFVIHKSFHIKMGFQQLLNFILLFENVLSISVYRGPTWNLYVAWTGFWSTFCFPFERVLKLADMHSPDDCVAAVTRKLITLPVHLALAETLWNSPPRCMGPSLVSTVSSSRIWLPSEASTFGFYSVAPW